MPVHVVIPKVAMSMTEGTLVDWLKPDGEVVAAGDPLFELESEKATLTVEAEGAGRLVHMVAAGTTLEPGSVIGYILLEGETAPTQSEVEEPHAQPAAGSASIEQDRSAASRPGGRVFATPVSRRIAREHGIDLATVAGTGPNGRVRRRDIEALLSASASSPSEATVTKRNDAADIDSGGAIAFRGMRGVIAERMQFSLSHSAQFTIGAEIGMDAAVRFREDLLREGSNDGLKPSHHHLVIAAAAKALRLHPRLNAHVFDDRIEMSRDINVGFAVALAEGLVVPVIRHADGMSLREIVRETTRLTAAARQGELKAAEVSGATFTVTNLGSAGVAWFTPILNPPEAAILGVGALADRVGWVGAAPVRRRVISFSLTLDHRAVDGRPGAEFLQTLGRLLENPMEQLS